jgi:hypothetical protein
VAYLSASEIEDRLDLRFGITATIQEGDADIASDELDAMGPFIGYKLDSEQERAFPRTINPDGTENTDEDPPAAILDWIALAAYHTTTEETPGITSESIGSTSRSYASPKVSQTERRMERLLEPYFLKVGHLRTGYSTVRTWESYPDAPLDIWW